MQANFVIAFRMTSLISAVVSLMPRCQGWRHCLTSSVGCIPSPSYIGARFFCVDRGRYGPTAAAAAASSAESGHRFFFLCPGSGYLACRCRCDGLDDVICGGGGGAGEKQRRRHVIDDAAFGVRSGASSRKWRGPAQVEFPRDEAEVDSNGEVDDETTMTWEGDVNAISSNRPTLGNNHRTSSNRPSVTIIGERPTTTVVDADIEALNVGDEDTRMSATGMRSERGQGRSERGQGQMGRSEVADHTTDTDGNYSENRDSEGSHLAMTNKEDSILKILVTSSYRKATTTTTTGVGTMQVNNHVTEQRSLVTSSRTIDDVTLSDARSDGWNDTDVIESAFDHSSYDSAAAAVNPSGMTDGVTSADVIGALVTTPGGRPTTSAVVIATATMATAVVTKATLRWTLIRRKSNGTQEGVFQAEFRGQVERDDGAMTSSVLLYDDCVISGSAMAFVAMVFVLVSMVVVLNCYGRHWGDHVTHWHRRRTITSPESRDLHENDRTCPMMTPMERISDVHEKQDKEAY